MEYIHKDYDFRLVLNPTDFVLRAEHTETHRVYEGTFRASDFGEYLVLGGLEFVIKLLQSGFNETDGARVDPSSQTPGLLTVMVHYSSPILAKPICISLDLPSIRRSEAGVEVAMIDKHVKAMEARITELESHLSSLKYLEETFGRVVYLPGINGFIPKNLEKLTFIGSVHCGAPFDLGIPHNITSSCIGRVHTSFSGLSDSPGIYVNTTPTEFTNIKFMNHLKILSFVNCSSHDYSFIKELVNLTELSICGHVNWTGGSPYPFSPGSYFKINDISWIKSLKKLKTLRLIGCEGLTDPSAIARLPALRTLDVRLSNGMECLPDLPASVTVHK